MERNALYTSPCAAMESEEGEKRLTRKNMPISRDFDV